MYLDPETDDPLQVVRALVFAARALNPAAATLLHEVATIHLDGANDRVVFQFPAPAAADVRAEPALGRAFALAVDAVLGPRIGAYLADLGSTEPPTVLIADDEDADLSLYEPPSEAPPEAATSPVGQGSQPRSPFERAKQVAEDGAEFWSSRELAPLLGYDSYRNFENAITKAKDACELSGHEVTEHFIHGTEAVAIGKGGTRQVDVVYLSRYACYLVIQNADSRKPMVALGQTYFTVQTRRQELADEDLEDSLRVKLREEIKLHNKQLAAAAYHAGVRTPMDYAVFNDHGYKGLYNGLGASQIRENRGLKRSQDILDFMGSTELAANLFRATQTEELLRRGGVHSKDQANMTHLQVGIKVREAMKDISGIMPEDLPVAENIKQVEKRLLKKRAETGQLEGSESRGG